MAANAPGQQQGLHEPIAGRSSGATYFTMATLCAVLVVLRAVGTRWAGLAAPVVGFVMWLATNDGHGVLVVEGFGAGALLSGLCVLGRGTRPAARPAGR